MIGLGDSILTPSIQIALTTTPFPFITGELTWVGSGFFAATGSPMFEYLAISGEYGQGGSFWIGSGYASFVGSPQLESDSIAGVYLTGEYICNDGASPGLLTWTG